MGKNLAIMELQVFTATIFRRYTFILESPNEHVSPPYLVHPSPADRVRAKFDTVEGFIRKPVSCRVGMKRR